MYQLLLKIKYLFSSNRPEERLVAENAEMYVLLEEMYNGTKYKNTRWAKRTRKVLDGHIESEAERQKEIEDEELASSSRRNLRHAYRVYREESHPGHPMNHGDK